VRDSGNVTSEYTRTSRNLATLGFGLNAPCLSCCALRLGFCPCSGLKYVKVCSPAAPCSRLLGGRAPFTARLTVQSPKLFMASLFTFENLNKVLIFFPTMTLIDIRLNKVPAHRCQASACKISPPYVALFQRR